MNHSSLGISEQETSEIKLVETYSKEARFHVYLKAPIERP